VRARRRTDFFFTAEDAEDAENGHGYIGMNGTGERNDAITAPPIRPPFPDAGLRAVVSLRVQSVHCQLEQLSFPNCHSPSFLVQGVFLPIC